MEEKRFIDRLKRPGPLLWLLFIGLMGAGLFAIIGGAKIYSLYKGTEEGIIIIVGIVLCIFGEMFFLGVGIVEPFIQWKKGITIESNLVWQSGILTPAIIRKDIDAHRKSKIVGYIVVTVLLLLIAVPILIFSEQLTLGSLITACTPFITIFLAIKEIIAKKKNCTYRIEEDRVIRTYVKKTFDAIDAATNHLPTKTPTIVFEKYGEYPVDSMHIHAFYPPEALIEFIEKGEEVYIVFSQNGNKLLHIYRKKFWSLEQK